MGTVVYFFCRCGIIFFMNGDGTMTENQDTVVKYEDKKSHKKIILIVGAIVILAAMAAFYLLYWVKTPQYSLNIIKESVAKHDLMTFERHVNLQNISTQAIDDMIATTISPEDRKNPLILGMINIVKAAAVPTFITQAQKYVETGKFAKLNEQNDGQVIVASVAERTGLMTMEFKGIEKTSRNKDEAIVTIKIWDQQLEKNFELQLKMKQLDDGTWCLDSISNLKTFMAARDRAVEKRLAELNKPIQEKIKEKVQLITDGPSPVSVERIAKDSALLPSYTIKVWLPFKVLAPNIKSVSGTFVIYDSDKKVIFSRDFDSGNADLSKSKDGLWHFNNSWPLNSYDVNDKEISTCDLSQTTNKVIFTGVSFTDGTDDIKCYNILPAK